jgi:transcriptional regulator with XRE-family HTH domain
MSQPTIADRVRSALALRRFTQERAGEEIGLTQKAMSRRLTGEVEFSASELQKLAGLLDVPVSSFYGEVPA